MDLGSLVADITDHQEGQQQGPGGTGGSGLANEFVSVSYRQVNRQVSHVGYGGHSTGYSTGFVTSSFVSTNTAVSLRYLPASDAIDAKARKTFTAAWSNTSIPAYVTDVFLINHDSPEAKQHLSNHKRYQYVEQIPAYGDLTIRRQAVQSHTRGQYLSYTYHGTQRACLVGETASETTPCNRSDCYLCSIMRSSFQLKYIGTGNLFGKGFYSSVNPYKASMYGSNRNNGSSKHALLICTVVTGRKELLYSTDTNKTKPSPGFDSVEGVPTSQGGAVLYPETIVYEEDAILPHALIMYTDTMPITHQPAPHGIPVDGGIYTIVNARFSGNAMDLSVTDLKVIGYQRHGNVNQQWIFRQQPGGGWSIQNKSRGDKYLGTNPSYSRSNGTEVVCVDWSARGIWDIQAAVNGTYRIACWDSRSTNLDLNKWTGARSLTGIVLWDHTVDGEHQRWNFVYVGQDDASGLVQSPRSGSSYSVTNALYKTVIDMTPYFDVIGHANHGGDNQQWVFISENGGWTIRSKQNAQKYLGLQHGGRSNGTQLEITDYAHRVTWDVQSAMNGTVRIACKDSPSLNLDLSKWGGSQNGTRIVLWSHTVNGGNQRWELRLTS